jgi:hypothetical protein
MARTTVSDWLAVDALLYQGLNVGRTIAPNWYRNCFDRYLLQFGPGRSAGQDTEVRPLVAPTGIRRTPENVAVLDPGCRWEAWLSKSRARPKTGPARNLTVPDL